MFNIKLFYEADGEIHLNNHIIIVRYYNSIKKEKYEDVEMYLNDEGLKEMKEQHIAKHQLLELISEETIDTNEYKWMEGISLRTDNPFKEIAEIASYGSLEAYEASLPETIDAAVVDTDYRLSKLELGI